MTELQQTPATAIELQMGSQALNMGQKYVDQNVIFSYGYGLNQTLTWMPSDRQMDECSAYQVLL